MNVQWSRRIMNMKSTWVAVVIISCLAPTSVIAQSLWTEAADTPDIRSQVAGRYSLPSHYRAVVLEVEALETQLSGKARKAKTAQQTLLLPAPDGTSREFVIRPSGVLPDALRAKYPELATYEGFAVDDPTITARVEFGPSGLSAQVLEPGKRWMIDPRPGLTRGLAISYYTGDTTRSPKAAACLVETEAKKGAADRAEKKTLTKGEVTQDYAQRSSGAAIREYRIAVATTAEYGQFHGGDTSFALAAVVRTINRVDGILEKEMSISLKLVDDNDKIVFVDPASQPFYGNDDAYTLIDESQAQIDAIIGSDNYDIGHTFSTGAGGLAQLQSVCRNGDKARGVTGSPQPEGDLYDVDYVAHEIGHQLGGNHTFNGSALSCAGGNRNALTAYEPGSGSTIQAYPGLCASDNLQGSVDPIYHSESFDEMYGYVSQGLGQFCGELILTGNTAPVVNAGEDYTVPKGTPLVVTGAAFDNQQTELTYLWEQRDLGPQAALFAEDDGKIPLFRVLTPTASPSRYLPSLETVVSGNFDNSEKIPQVAREMDMRLTVRDGAGGVNSDDMIINVNGASGPFAVTVPNGGEAVGGSKTIKWDVAGTDQMPIGVDQVEVLLSTDGGQTFDTSLGVTANDGSHTVVFPAGVKSLNARLMIKAVDNIFYDVSDSNFDLDADRILPSAPVSTSIEATNGGAIINFSPGADNGAVITGYSATCTLPDTEESSSYSASPEEYFDEFTPITSQLEIDESIAIEPGGLRVSVDITHSYRGDIVLSLVSPAETRVQLLLQDGGDNSIDLVGTYPTTLAPEESLDGFVGEDSKGTWTLDVSDYFEEGDDTGVLNSWGITLVTITLGDEVTVSGTQSPLTLSGMTNGESYECEIIAYAGSDASETVVLGSVTPGSGATDNDSDADGVSDANDAFPNDPAASVDTDGDGMPDNWNAGASQTDIDESTLELDTDDDNDGYSDLEEAEAGTSSTDGSDTPAPRSRLLLLQSIIDALKN